MQKRLHVTVGLMLGLVLTVPLSGANYFSQVGETMEGVYRLNPKQPRTSPNDPNTPELGAILLCENWDGHNVPFQVVDVANGENYNVWVLDEVAGNNGRVGWNNQLPQTFSGLSLVREENNKPLNIGPVFWFYNTDDVDITGLCGDFLAYSYALPAMPSSVCLTVNFSGGTETRTDAQGEIQSTQWSIGASSVWSIVVNLIDSSRTLGEEFGLSKTEQLTQNASITLTTVKKGFHQCYQVTDP